jgi:hypothetical protein
MDQIAKKSPVLALAIGFLPAALLLLIGTISGQSGPSSNVLWPIFLACLVCCFASSFMLFRRKTAWSILGGLLLLLLNGAISLFTGCFAVVRGMKF